MAQVDSAALTTYLNDHLAGSVVALELMGRLCVAHVDTELGALLTELRDEVEEEQGVLRQLIRDTGGSEHSLTMGVAWLGEKMVRLKFGPGEKGDSGLMLFETLEALSLGFWGRRALWRALDQLQRETGENAGLDFAYLARRAERHLFKLEELRLEASLTALTQPADV